MMETQLVVRSREITPTVWGVIQSIAPAMYASGLFGVKSEQQAEAIMLKGYELGLTFSASFEFIHVVQGKPGLSPRGALALIQGYPELERIEIEDVVDDSGHPESCKVYMERTNGFNYTATFSMKDADRAGLIKSGGGWQKYPSNMLRWRAVGFCADVVFPDVLGGMKRTDELGADLTPDGDTLVIEAEEWKEIAPQGGRRMPMHHKRPMAWVDNEMAWVCRHDGCEAVSYAPGQDREDTEGYWTMVDAFAGLGVDLTDWSTEKGLTKAVVGEEVLLRNLNSQALAILFDYLDFITAETPLPEKAGTEEGTRLAVGKAIAKTAFESDVDFEAAMVAVFELINSGNWIVYPVEGEGLVCTSKDELGEPSS